MTITDVCRDDSGYSATIDGVYYRHLNGEIDYPTELCHQCGRAEVYDDDGLHARKLYAGTGEDGGSVVLCEECLKTK